MQGVLEYPVDKTKLVVNRDAEDIGIKADFLEEKLGISICAKIPSDGRLAVQAANTGVPFVLSSPKAPISQGSGPGPRNSRRRRSHGSILDGSRESGLFRQNSPPP